MNPFFDISGDTDLPDSALPLHHLGDSKTYASIGKTTRVGWGGRNTEWNRLTTTITSEDYDQQFVRKLVRWKPIYNLAQVIDHHYEYYLGNNVHPQDDFLNHMRYVILPILKKKPNSEVCVQLFEKWLDEKENPKPAIITIPKPGAIKKTVHRIHFDDLSWSDFERLIFAFVKRLRTWKTIDWLGQMGHDEGQDIWGESLDKTYCYLCANYQSLTLKKAKDDINKLIKANVIPDYLIVVCGGKVAAGTNKNIKTYAQGVGIQNVEIWSGADIEENIRVQAPGLLQRFFEGNSFPENGAAMTDMQIIKELVNCFDRTTFQTPFYREVSIPDFGKAITDTIEVLNTGVHRLRDGTLVKQIPSRHQIQNKIF